MILELSFLAGRYHATAWGRHVNEAVPEWPPSPFRVVRALLDAWFRKHGEIPREVVEALFQKLALPPMFLLPPARAAHTRSYLSQNREDPSDKKLVFDGFAVIGRETPVLMGWPGLVLTPPELAAAQALSTSLNYLGRSESWVHARVLDDREARWNCVPLEPGVVPGGKEAVPVACVTPPAQFEARGLTVKAGRKLARLTWFDALSWGSAEAMAHTMNRPPGLEPVFYLREADALDARPPPTRRQSGRLVEAVRFRVDARVAAPMTEALRVGEHVRRNLMGAFGRLDRANGHTPTFSGKDAEGRPLQGHRHVSILCLDEDQDGLIDGVLVASPAAFTREEQRAIDRLRPVPRRNGFPLVLTPAQLGTRDSVLGLSSEVGSTTPFVPYHHWKEKRDGDFATWLARQVTQECVSRGLPAPSHIARLERPTTKRRVRWLDFRRARKGGAPQPAFGLRLTFSVPVATPFSLGAFSHFGLGAFAATSQQRGPGHQGA